MNIAVIFLDVGQGDCTIAVDAENGEAILIDCPAGRSGDAVDGLVRSGAGHLSLAFASHSDFDHLGGLYEVLNRVGADEVRVNLDSIVPAGEAAGGAKLRAAQRALAGLSDRGVTVRPCYSGDSGSRGEVRWRALSPTHELLLLAQGRGDRNIGSVILRLEVANVRILVGGDAPTGAFRRAIERGEELKADVFRLSHHGGRIDHLGPPKIGELLDEIDAEYHIVSVGSGNTYGHPTFETLEELGRRSRRARVMCTEVNAICLGQASMPRNEAETLPEPARMGTGDREGACRCAGSVWLRISDEGWAIMPSEEDHARVISALDRPMCRTGG